MRRRELEGRTLDAEYRDEWSDASAQSVRSALGDQRYAECLAEGRAMSVDDAVACALEIAGAEPPPFWHRHNR